MQIQIYAIFDTKVGSFQAPFFMHNDAVAKRSVSSLLMDPNAPVAQHPEDYALFSIGTYDDIIGLVTGESSPIFVCQLRELVEWIVSRPE